MTRPRRGQDLGRVVVESDLGFGPDQRLPSSPYIGTDFGTIVG